MPRVTFISSNGKHTTVEGDVGQTLMHTAVANDVDGVIGECGGSMMCATCHCYVDEAWSERTGERHEGEAEMLDCAVSAVRPTSRLSCQIELTPALDGLILYLPEAQQ